MKKLVWIVAGALMLALCGCGGDDKSPTQPIDPAGAEAEVQLASAALAAGNYTEANAHFKAAIDKDPSNTKAQIGAAVTEVYLVQNDPEVAAIVNQLGGSPRPQNSSTPVSRIGSMLGGGLDYGPKSLGRSFFKVLAMVVDDPPAVSQVQQVIKTRVMPRLQYAENRLNLVEADPNFSFFVRVSYGGVLDSVEIDRGDAYMLDAVVNGVQGWLGMLVAYNFDVENSDFENVDAESLLAAGTAWATLHSDGALQLATAKTNLQLVNVRFDQGVTAIIAETDDQSDDLIPQETIDTPSFQEQVQQIDQLAAALSGPIDTEVDDYQGVPYAIRVDIGHFFVPAIADLKTKLPSHTFDKVGDPQITPPITFTDPTINGIFPQMTNTKWQELTGIVPPPALAARSRR